MEKVRPEIKPELVKKLQRFAVANSISLTAAVNLLLAQALKNKRH